MSAGAAVAAVIGFAVFFAAFWSAVCFAIGAFGWRWLAAAFPARAPFTGPSKAWVGGRVGLARYNTCLIVGADPSGLSLSVVPIFRPGHAPLFIPWEHVTAARRTSFGFFRYLSLSIRDSSVVVKLDQGLEEFLRTASAGRMPPVTD